MASILTKQVSDEIARIVSMHTARVLSTPGATLELEARFRIAPDDSALFNRIVDIFSTRATPSVVNVVDVVQQMGMGDVWRKSSETRVGENVARVYYTHKRNLWKHENSEYNVRLSVASEEVRDEPPRDVAERFGEREVGSTVRVKHRTSFHIMDGAVRLDATKVRMHVPGRGDQTSHEIELEVVDGRNIIGTLGALRAAIGYLLTLVQESDIPIPNSERSAVIAYISALISEREPAPLDKLFFSSLVQARDLTIRDLVYGGLVGNPKTGYTVTIKADGERRLLVFTRWGVFFALPPGRLNKISREALPDLEGTVLDGEYLPPTARKNATPEMLARHVWLAFDCLADRGRVSIRTEDHLARLRVCQNVTEALSTPRRGGEVPIPSAIMRTKVFYTLRTPQNFYMSMAKLALELPNIPYHEDGVMFTPINAPYIPTRDRSQNSNKVLTHVPDVCKWKPSEKHSIDLAITILPAASRRSGALPFDLAVTGKVGTNAFSAKDGGGSLVAWRGTRRYPFEASAESVDMTTPILDASNLPAHGTVIEFRWDAARGKIVPMRHRRDKIAPNFITVAQEVWSNIMNPIEWSTLLGRDFRQLRALHNSIKAEILENLGQRDLVVDVGSGNGGDISKWKNFSRVVGIEPDAEHRAEMARRLAEAPDAARRIEVHEGTGTHLERYVPRKYHGRADLVTFMLSLSFFFARDESGAYKDLDALARGIAAMLKEGSGEIAFLTVNGDAVVRVLRPDLAEPALPLNVRGQTRRALETNPISSPKRSPSESASPAPRPYASPRRGAVRDASPTILPRDDLNAINWDDVPGTVVRLESIGGGEPRRGKPMQVFINIPNSIVEDQTEYLVDISALVRALNRVAPGRGWHVKWHERTSSDPRAAFLPHVSDALNRMYSFGIIAQGQISSKDAEEAFSSSSEETQKMSDTDDDSQKLEIAYTFEETPLYGMVMIARPENVHVLERVRELSSALSSERDDEFAERALLAYIATTGGIVGTEDDFVGYARELIKYPLSEKIARTEDIKKWDERRGFSVDGQGEGDLSKKKDSNLSTGLPFLSYIRTDAGEIGLRVARVDKVTPPGVSLMHPSRFMKPRDGRQWVQLMFDPRARSARDIFAKCLEAEILSGDAVENIMREALSVLKSGNIEDDVVYNSLQSGYKGRKNTRRAETVSRYQGIRLENSLSNLNLPDSAHYFVAGRNGRIACEASETLRGMRMSEHDDDNKGQTRIPHGDETFDLVIALEWLHSDERISLSLNELHRILKPGGILIIGDYDTLDASHEMALSMLDVCTARVVDRTPLDVRDYRPSYFSKSDLERWVAWLTPGLSLIREEIFFQKDPRNLFTAVWRKESSLD